MPNAGTANGAHSGENQLRIVFIGPSIRSDWRNPAAHVHRAVMSALNDRGHQTAFLEARRNAAVEGLLGEQGAAALLAFDETFPGIEYRSYDPPPRRELGVWLGREGATADVVILLEGMDPDMVTLFQQTHILDVARLLERPKESGSVLIDLDSGVEVCSYVPAVPIDSKDLLVLSLNMAKSIERAHNQALLRR